MKNWKKIGQYFATGAGAALLASFASLFAFSEAHAASLVKDDSGAVTRIEGLSVFLDGEETIYDVDFLRDDSSNVYGDGAFDFADSKSAQAAARAVSTSLGSSEYITKQGDMFIVGYGDIGDRVFIYRDRWVRTDFDTISWYEYDINLLNAWVNIISLAKWAKFEVRDVSDKVVGATTPEPSLIFGFITLGGLMLGSRKSNFIFHQTIPPSKSDISP
ncbi:MAG: PEP-CTERM sorting domain-containing protein [Okeania sp. SIO1H6]|nr:PEP-CTERM sorting domain-containing protein [Okeania sp. SIO1H6]